MTALLLSAVLLFPCAPAVYANSGNAVSVTVEQSDADIQFCDLSGIGGRKKTLDAHGAQELVEVIVSLDEEPILCGGTMGEEELPERRNMILEQQAGVIEMIGKIVGNDGLTADYRYTMTVNAFAITVPCGVLEEIKKLEHVADVCVAGRFFAPSQEKTADEGGIAPTALEMIGADEAGDSGYDGTGVLVAVLDTGLDLNHPAFSGELDESRIKLDRDGVSGLLEKLNAYQESEGLTVDDVYRSSKVPFAFNYADRSNDVSHDHDSEGDHGTHVSGIIAANDRENVEAAGVAPGAQLLVMKVFGNSEEGASETALVAALEDAVLLGADVINMSLGVTAGFSSEKSLLARAISRASDAGIIICAAAGNEISSAYGNNSGLDLGTTANIDIGAVSMPGSLDGALSIASANNAGEYSCGFYISEADGTSRFVPVADSGANFGMRPFTSLAEQGESWEYAVVPGIGTAEDFSQTNVKGKIALVRRGTITFAEKCEHGYTSGAAAVLIYNNESGTALMDLSGVPADNDIPCAAISDKDGALLLERAENGYGRLTVCGQKQFVTVEDGYCPSDFSSWGALPDLTLKPDFSGVGRNIYSTLNGGTYGMMSGTSMAAPQAAGMLALMLQYLREECSMTGREAALRAKTLLMNSSIPAQQQDGVEYSPRKQGAGLAQVGKAVKSPAIITVEDNELPKAELGDDPWKTGTFTFEVTASNMTGLELEYVTDVSLMTECAEAGYMLQRSRSLDARVTFTSSQGNLRFYYDLDGDGRVDEKDAAHLLDRIEDGEELDARWLDLNGDGSIDVADAECLAEAAACGGTREVDVGRRIVTVPGNGSVTLQVRIELTAEAKKELDRTFENGIYVEGYLYFQNEEERQDSLTVPMLAFYGDWSMAPLFEQTSLAEFMAGSGSESVGNCPYPFEIVTGDQSYLGMNPASYDEEYIPERSNALNTSGGEGGVIQDIYLDLLRSARTMTVEMRGASGAVLYRTEGEYVPKACYDDAVGEMRPAVWSRFAEGFRFVPADAGLRDGDSFTIRIAGEKDCSGAYRREEICIPAYVDGTEPEIRKVNVKRGDALLDSCVLEVTARDNFYVSAVVVVAADGETVVKTVPVDQRVRGETVSVTLDVTDVLTKIGGEFLIGVLDYAQNMELYKVNVLRKSDTTLLADGLLMAYSTDYMRKGWYELSPEGHELSSGFMDYLGGISAAESVGNYIFTILNESPGLLYVIDTCTFQPEPVLSTSLRAYTDAAIDMAYDREDGYLYLLARVDLDYVLMRIDLLREKCETVLTLGKNGETDLRRAHALTCGKDGNLYLVLGTGKEGEPETAVLYSVRMGEPLEVTRVCGLELSLENGVVSTAADPETGVLYLAHYAMESDPETGDWTVHSSLYAWQDGEEMTMLRELEKIPFDVLLLTGAAETDFDPAGEVTQIVLSERERHLLPGGSFRLEVADTRPWYIETDEWQMSFSSGDEKVARVDKTGTVTAVTAGETEITVTLSHPDHEDVAAVCRVIVDSDLWLRGLSDGPTGPEWVELSTQNPGTMSPAENLPVEVWAAAYAAECGPEGQDVIYMIGPAADAAEGEGNECVLYICDAAGEEVITCRSLTKSWFVTSITGPETIFSDMAYDPYTGFLLAVCGNCCVTIDPQTFQMRRAYDVSEYVGNMPLTGLAFEPDGTGWLLDSGSTLYRITEYDGISFSCRREASLGNGWPQAGKVSMELDELRRALWISWGRTLYLVILDGAVPRTVRSVPLERELSCLFMAHY